VFVERLEDRHRRKAKHSRIPDVIPRLEIGGGVGERRFLDEAPSAKGTGDAERLAALDVAVTCFGMRGTDSKSGEPSRTRERSGMLDRRSKRILVVDQMVSGQHEHRRIVAIGVLHVQRS
jgi:hypothetical protein